MCFREVFLGNDSSARVRQIIINYSIVYTIRTGIIEEDPGRF